jgi:hypothetical protein
VALGLCVLWLAYRLGKQRNRNLRIAQLVTGFNSESSRKEALGRDIANLKRRLRTLGWARFCLFWGGLALGGLGVADLFFEVFGGWLCEALASLLVLAWLLGGGSVVAAAGTLMRLVLEWRLSELQARASQSTDYTQRIFAALVEEFGEEFNEPLAAYVTDALAEKLCILEKRLARSGAELARLRVKSEQVMRIHDFYRSTASYVLAFRWSIRHEKLQPAAPGEKPARGLLQTNSHPALQRQDSSCSLQSSRSGASGQIEFQLEDRVVPARDCPVGSGALRINRCYQRELRSFFAMLKSVQERADKNADLQLELSDESEDAEPSSCIQPEASQAATPRRSP